MRTTLPVALAALAACLLAACSSTAHHTATRPAAPRPTVTLPSEAMAFPPHVSLSPQAGYLPRGPFALQPRKCGKLTKGQRSRFGTTARRGLIYRYTNVSRSFTGSPVLTVDFLRGTNLVGSNVTGELFPVKPGDSAEAEVDAVGLSGQQVKFTTCELTGYSTANADGSATGNYAP